MIPTNFQRAEIRDSNDNIIQQGAYGKNSALSNATNDGWIDYVMNNLEALKGESDQAATVEYVDETLTNYATLESPALTGTPTAPTPTADDDSTKVATTEFVQDAKGEANAYTDTKIAAEVTRSDGAYLPFTGGTITGNLSVNGTLTGNLTGNVTGNVTGDLTGNADTATKATNDGNGNPIASTYLPLSGGTLTGNVTFNGGVMVGKESNSRNYKGIYESSSAPSQYSGLAFRTVSGVSTFTISVRNPDSTASYLVGENNGTLTWNGNNVALAKDVLPLSGGTMTGTITNTQSVLAKRDVDTANIILYAGKDNTSSYIAAWGKNNSSTAGVLQLRCSDGTNVSGLLAYPDGSLTWGGVSLTNGTFLTTRSVSVNASSGTASYTITAPAVSGYQFICWYMSASNGNMYPTYINNSNTSSTKVWAVNPTNNTTIVCFALYVRKW